MSPAPSAADGSPATVGLQLTKDGKVTFDKAKFATALKDTPALAQRMIGGTPAAAGAAGRGTPSRGIAERLLDVAKAASDSTTGSLVALANGKDSAGQGPTRTASTPGTCGWPSARRR